MPVLHSVQFKVTLTVRQTPMGTQAIDPPENFPLQCKTEGGNQFCCEMTFQT